MQAYLELKLSWELFAKAPEALSEPEKGKLKQVAGKQDGIERRILKSPEAAGIIIPDDTLRARLAEIRGRYLKHEDYLADLEGAGLDEESLADAVKRDLQVEAVLDKVAAAVPQCSATDAEIYYRLHPDAFHRPEARRLRHILITFNNPQEKARALHTLEELRRTLAGGGDFARAAQRHSQCPTALQGGELGVVKLGQLYAELEPGAFALAAGEYSAPLESPIGLHLFRCDEVFAAGPMPFEQVSPRIAEKLTEQRRRQAQRAWIAALPA